MKRLQFPIFTVLWCLVLLTGPADAARPPIQPAADGERFLFVVETTTDTEKIQAAVEATLYDLISTGIYGQALTGDTYGMWTFSKTLQTGKFPMQVWDGRRAAQQAAVTAAFLGGLDYEDSSSDLKPVMEKLATVIHSVSNLNVFIISDGDTAMKGTPFDKAINAEYKKRRRERSSAKRPFVTTLIVRNGLITEHSVHISGDPIKLPERPPPPPPARKPAPSAPVQTQAVDTNTIPVPAASVIATQPAISDSKAEIPPAATVPPTNAPRKRVMQIITQSNILTAAKSPLPPQLPGEDQTATASTASTNPASVTASVTPPPNAPGGASSVEPADTNNVVTPAPSSAQSALAAILPEPITVSARELNSEREPVANEIPAAFQATAIPMQGGVSATWLLTVGGTLLGAAVFLIVAVLRRPRPNVGASLITQSMNRR